MSDARHYLEHLLETGRLKLPAFQRALLALGELPDTARWRKWVDRLLMAGGAMMFLSGVVTFFAFNWHRLPGFGKLLLAQGAWLSVTLLALRLDWKRPAGQWALFGASTLIGVVFAVIGQVYQTGADPWQLFTVWAVLMLPWTVLARFEPLWGLWLVISLVALLTWQAVFAPEQLRWLDGGPLNLPLLAALCAALAGWEYAARNRPHWTARVVPRLLGFALATALSMPAWWGLLDHYGYQDGSVGFWLERLIFGLETGILPYLVWAGATLFIYLRRRDLVLVSLPMFSGMVTLLILVGRAIDRFENIFLLALLALGLCIGIASWLRHLQRSWSTPGEAA